VGEVTQLLALDRRQLLDGLDRFRAKVESGEVDGYFLVGVGDGDLTVPMWGACGKGITILRGLGAIEALKHKFISKVNWE
jgi:hypothetical protein